MHCSTSLRGAVGPHDESSVRFLVFLSRDHQQYEAALSLPSTAPNLAARGFDVCIGDCLVSVPQSPCQQCSAVLTVRLGWSVPEAVPLLSSQA